MSILLYTSSQTTQVEKEVPAAPAKKVRVKKPPARHVETKSDKTKSSVLPAHMEEFLGRRSTLKSQEELEDEIAQSKLLQINTIIDLEKCCHQ